MKIIYKIKNKKTNKVYIGQTVNFENRVRTHKYSAKNESFPISESIKKHGFCNFDFTKIIICEDEFSDYYEKELIKVYNSCNPMFGYNSQSGGINGFKTSKKTINKMKSKIVSPEHKEKISKKLTGRKRSPETKMKISNSLAGRKRKLETRLKISESHKNRNR